MEDRRQIAAVLSFQRGRPYAATLRDGLVRVDPDGSIRRVPAPDPWLLHISNAAGRLWVGTQGGAAAIASGVPTPLPDLPHPSVHAIPPTRDGVWVATEGGTALR
jgi:hypothetical protein